MPPLENIMVIRHAESQEDIDPNVKGILQDSDIELTPKGIDDCKTLAFQLKKELENFNHITLYVSPYKRTMQTADIILDQLKDLPIELKVENSLRSLNWGNIDPSNLKKIEQERYKTGALYYCFPGGDNTPFYVKNIYDFVFNLINEKHIGSPKNECVLIVAHGFSFRIIVKAFTDMTDEDFKWIKNPPNTYVSKILFDPKTQAFIIEQPLKKIEEKI